MVPSCEALSVAMTKSTPALRWKAICASMMSASSRASTVRTSVTAYAAACALLSVSFCGSRTAGLLLERQQPRLEQVEPPLDSHDVGLAERGDVDCVGRLVDDGRPRKREPRLAVDG